MEKQRKRQVNVKKLSGTDAENLGVEIGKKLGEITTDAEQKANTIGEIYGFKVILNMQFVDLKTGQILS